MMKESANLKAIEGSSCTQQNTSPLLKHYPFTTSTTTNGTRLRARRAQKEQTQARNWEKTPPPRRVVAPFGAARNWNHKQSKNGLLTWVPVSNNRPHRLAIKLWRNFSENNQAQCLAVFHDETVFHCFIVGGKLTGNRVCFKEIL